MATPAHRKLNSTLTKGFNAALGISDPAMLMYINNGLDALDAKAKARHVPWTPELRDDTPRPKKALKDDVSNASSASSSSSSQPKFLADKAGAGLGATAGKRKGGGKKKKEGKKR